MLRPRLNLTPNLSEPVHATERAFGTSVGLAVGLAAGYELWRGRIVAAEVCAVLAAVLCLLAVSRPIALRLPCQWWWHGARALGWVNARVLLTIFFWFVLTPMSLVLRLAGHDPLRRQHVRGESGWAPVPQRLRDTSHYTRMY